MKGLSPRAQRLIVALAQDEGRKSGGTELLPEHVLLALLKSADGLGYILLQNLHINVLTFQLHLEQSLPAAEHVSSDFSDLPPSRRLRTLVDMAAIESRSLRNDYVGTEHLLLAAMREEQSPTWRFFERAGLPIDNVRHEVQVVQRNFFSSASDNQRAAKEFANSMMKSLAGGGDAPQQKNQQKKSFLADFSRDLTALARENKIDPVVGREKEIHRCVQILSRRTKNNPVLIGEPGVGKTAIAEGLAQHIAAGDVPRDLLKKRREDLKLSREALSRKTGLSVMSIRRYESILSEYISGFAKNCIYVIRALTELISKIFF